MIQTKRAKIILSDTDGPKAMPDMNTIQPLSTVTNDIFGWEVGEYLAQKQKERYGFIYKCIADNTSDTSQWLGLESAIGRNAVSAIVKCHESHLLNGIVTIYYPETGLSPKLQSAFVWMVSRHPQAGKITELRILTRSAWFISDCDRENVRIINNKSLPLKHQSSDYVPKGIKKSVTPRIAQYREDPFLSKEKKIIFFNLADSGEGLSIYLGEDEQFVYWYKPGDTGCLRTDHYTFWYEANAILLTEGQADAVLTFAQKKSYLYSDKEMNELVRTLLSCPK
jgi:hypothetical protein